MNDNGGVGCFTIICAFVGGMLGCIIFNGNEFATGLFLIAGAIIGMIATEQEKEADQRVKMQKEHKNKLYEKTVLENEQKQLAHMEGLEKYHKMDVDDAEKYKKGVEAMRTLGMVMQQSVYQEKERDWAIWGGIADGIAGPAAGVATAIDMMQENEKIKAENAVRREWGAKQNAFYQDLASQAARKSPTALSMYELQKKYEVITTWHPKTLLSLIKIEYKSAKIDNETGAVDVSVGWIQNDKSICIDGALRAKLYTSTGECAGCAYLVLPKIGTSKFEGTLSGVCAKPTKSNYYSVVIEPVDLWELASKDNKASRKTDNLTIEEHRRIVEDYEKKYYVELK